MNNLEKTYSRCSETIQIFVQSAIDGKTKILNVNSLDCVGMIKIQMQEKIGIPVDQQRFIYLGVELENRCTLLECNVQKQSTVHLVLRLKGGMSSLSWFYGDETEESNDQQKQTNQQSHRSERQQRLDQGPTVTKYHNTDAHRAIIEEQKMKRGSSGWVGGGIYFADTEAETHGKTKNRGQTLQAKVQLGRTLTVTPTSADSNMTYSKLQNLGYDSVKLTGPSTGDEYVVYNSDQVNEIDYAGSTSSRSHSSSTTSSLCSTCGQTGCRKTHSCRTCGRYLGTCDLCNICD